MLSRITNATPNSCREFDIRFSGGELLLCFETMRLPAGVCDRFNFLQFRRRINSLMWVTLATRLYKSNVVSVKYNLLFPGLKFEYLYMVSRIFPDT